MYYVYNRVNYLKYSRQVKGNIENFFKQEVGTINVYWTDFRLTKKTDNHTRLLGEIT